ncbi:endonuclease/exonuclease/phosphatase family protein [Babesia caballi]|uniref:Endonuclease/exonuclease/phosphatase family protein n=1 Tax=Babesia caballi TaxID=5871 RepID=A0AAV4M1Z7_BABCB|nr:endonuclease/exonuclease/phosphatase family protein [Babesia caballi]
MEISERPLRSLLPSLRPGRTQRSRSKLYDPRKGSAYSKLSKTHELKLRKLQESKAANGPVIELHRCLSGNDSAAFENYGSGSYMETSDAGVDDSSSDTQAADQASIAYSANTGPYGRPCVRASLMRNSNATNSLQQSRSVPLGRRSDVKGHSSPPTARIRESQPSVHDFTRRIQVPYLEEHEAAARGLARGNVRAGSHSPYAPGSSDRILIESFVDSRLPSLKVSKERPQSFSMLTFNAGLLEVRMFGVQMYQNPGYTERRLKCVPSEIRKADADVVAFQEVYSNSHARYIVRELQDLYPYSARDDCRPVSEEFEHLYEKDKKHRKRGIGMFHSGLLFLSKFPILCARFHPWTVVTHLEALLANKGYLEIFVDVPTVGKVAFYNMHMASASVNPESSHIENVRNEEVKQLLRTTERACRLGFAPIIIGDLNAAPNSCASNYMSFLHSGWTDSYVLSRQKVRHRKWLGLRGQRVGNHASPTPFSESSIDESIGVENVFGDDKSQKPHLDKVTALSNLPRSKTGVSLKASPLPMQEGSRWSRFVEYLSLARGDRSRRHSLNWQRVKAYYPRGSSMSLRVVHCRTINGRRTPRSLMMEKLRRKLLKHRVRVSLKAPCLENRRKRYGWNLRERCSALFRKSRSLWMAEPKPSTPVVAVTTARSRAGIDPYGVYFLIRNPLKQVKRPRVKRFYWSLRRRRFMDVTWDPKNPLNMRGPHAGCSGLRCDYIFLPPSNIAGILRGFAPSAGEILFREPIVMIDKVGSAYNCLCSAFTSMKKVMLVTLSDHYGLKITMVRKNVVPEGAAGGVLRPVRTI